MTQTTPPAEQAPAVLPPALRGWFGPVAGLAASVVALLAFRYAGEGEPGTLDARIGAAVDGVRPPWRSVALFLDSLGEPVGATALVAVLVTGCLVLRRPRAAVFGVAAIGLTVGAATLLKHLVGRTIHGDNLSYPSGHTAFATALALVPALLATGRRGHHGPGPGPGFRSGLALAAAAAAGAAMGWAQVALGAHYPTDALAGWCTALAVVPATAWLVDRTADAGRPERR
ncbi:phosphatase PAP2 family protein [Kitasatospora sp. NPDC101157]|uniref:phosphatase PAP2 family protein n=1 Tax=Kitasatospora sp. NPDC101157 TaxID=3364098 RepID=UPI0037F1BA26